MKKNLLLLLVLIFALSFAVSANVFAAGLLDDSNIVAENEYLVLYMDKSDTSFAVKHKASGKIWYSNPENRKSTQAAQNAQLNIVYNPNSVTKDNYTYSNQYDRYEVIPIENGVRIEYQFVEKWTANDYLPQLISAERFEEKILNRLEGRDRDQIRSYYYLVKLRKLEDGEQPIEIRGLESEKIFKDYTLEILEDDFQKMLQEAESLTQQLKQLEAAISAAGDGAADLQAQKNKLESNLNKIKQSIAWDQEDIIWHLIQNVIIANRADLTKVEDVTFADIEQMVDTPTYVRKSIPRASLSKLSQIIESTGYSPIDATEDHIANNINPTVPNLEIFDVTIEYLLDGESFIVRVPVDEVKYPIDVVDFSGEKHTYPIMFLEILPYFSAAGLNDEGYIFVPDGSGALIYLNNGKTWTSTYNQGVYGRDFTEDPYSYQTAWAQQVNLPVFGLKKGDQAYLAIIERGASIAHLRADISGKRDDYNRIFPRFNIIKSGRISLEHGGSLDVYQPEKYKGDIIVRYEFLVGDEASYTGMAQRYQKYLVEKNVLKPITESNPPFILELIGAFTRTEVVFGVPKDVIYPATTVAEVKSIIDDLRSIGIDNVQLRYRGWLKGGLEHYYPTKANIEKKLGSESEFIDLLKYAQANNTVIYPEVDFLNVYRNTLFDGFSSRSDSAIRLNRLPAQISNYDVATFLPRIDRTAYVLSPRVLPKLMTSFMNDFSRYNSQGIALDKMGWQVNSDFSRRAGQMVDRQHATEIISEQMANVAQRYNIMVDKGNAYTWPYVSTIVNIPLTDSGYDLVDQRIPFYQMVISGYITYAGEALNQVSDHETYLLMSLETGTLPYFSLAAAASEVIKGTKFNEFYSFNYDQWRDELIDCYQELYPIYQRIYGQRFVYHAQLQPGVTISTYENGVSIIVNYNNYPVEYAGVTIGARGYYLLEEDR